MKEKEIRSRDIQDKYLSLCAIDADRLAEKRELFVEVPCPACGESANRLAFSKQGYSYLSCDCCGSLYLSPRPTEAMLLDFNAHSDAAHYWASEFYPSCADKRRETVYKPRAEFVRALEKKYGHTFLRLADIGTGYGVFVEQLRQVFPSADVMGIEPGVDLAAECRRRGLPVFEGLLHEATGTLKPFDFCSVFEVLEHLFEPMELLKQAAAALTLNGVVFANTLCADGFDIQIMWEEHRNIYPPYHINIISLEGFRILFARAGFSGVEITTPGRLDVDIVRSQMAEERIPRFLRTIFRRDDEQLLRDLQAFLADHRLSSHVWITAQKSSSAHKQGA